MLFEEIPIIGQLMSYASLILFGGFTLYIVYKSNMIGQAKKMAEQSTSDKMYWSLYTKFLYKLFKALGQFLVKYAIYFAFYGFILINVYNMAGFEITVIAGLIFVLARIQLKKWTIIAPDSLKQFQQLQKKYALTKKMLDQQINEKEVKK